MSRRTCIIVACLLLMAAAALGGRPAGAQTWTISTLDSAGNVGAYVDLVVTPSGGLGVLYYRTDNHTLKYIASSGSVWGAAQVIDASALVGTSLSLRDRRFGKPEGRIPSHG